MKIVGITVVSLASALILGGALDTADNDKYSISRLNKAASANVTSLGYTYQWDYNKNSFDSVLWQAVGEISIYDSVIPNNITSFAITMHNADTTWDDIKVNFTRTGLELIMSGAITPEVFIREYVEFI